MDEHKRAIEKIIAEGQSCGEIGNAPPEHLFIIIMGTFRLMLTRWQYSGHGFTLMEEANALWASLASRITENK